jgi:hypothetical protein
MQQCNAKNEGKIEKINSRFNIIINIGKKDAGVQSNNKTIGSYLVFMFVIEIENENHHDGNNELGNGRRVFTDIINIGGSNDEAQRCNKSEDVNDLYFSFLIEIEVGMDAGIE